MSLECWLYENQEVLEGKIYYPFDVFIVYEYFFREKQQGAILFYKRFCAIAE